MSKKHRDNLIWGIVLIVLGGIFLLQNTGIDAIAILFKLWPLILIIWGGFKLYYGIKNKRQLEKTTKILPEDKRDES
ncbi:MAG: hypothetical protein JHC32_08890 [Candidatus Aminicenantes bacterium]|jgi:uncharacterized membrane protein|nr:hypothetical protein [Candidatus Aminicenantes bacterium]